MKTVSYYRKKRNNAFKDILESIFSKKYREFLNHAVDEFQMYRRLIVKAKIGDN